MLQANTHAMSENIEHISSCNTHVQFCIYICNMHVQFCIYAFAAVRKTLLVQLIHVLHMMLIAFKQAVEDFPVHLRKETNTFCRLLFCIYERWLFCIYERNAYFEELGMVPSKKSEQVEELKIQTMLSRTTDCIICKMATFQ